MKLYVSGGCCQTPSLLDTIRKRLNLPVEILDPFKKLICSKSEFEAGYLEEIGPLVAVAVGLAMRRQGDK
jgi:type IV pilus assembly protein PilM